MNELKIGITLLLTSLLAACGSSSGALGDAVGGALDESQCSTIGQNRFVYERMQDLYFWNQFLPTVNPDTYASPEALLDDLRYQPDTFDRNFTSIVDEVENTLFFEQGQFIGVGITLRSLGDRLFIVQVFPGSPAAQAGLTRGFELLEINGQAVAGLIAAENVSEAFGPDEVGTPVDLRYLDLQASEFTVNMQKALVTIQPVPVSTVFDVNGVQTGYLMFRTFIEPSVAALDNTFASFRDQGVTELILDLRYNGGGRVAVAEHLAGLIGGQATAGQVFGNSVHNANNAGLNRTTRFPNPSQSLGVSRVIVITSRLSASASELVINALRPFIQVVLVGERSFGKPVGSYGQTFCSKVLNVIAFNIRNAADEGDYFDGLPVDCLADDRLDVPFGDPAEDSTAEALFYVENGVCSAPPPARRSESVGPRARPIAESGWQLLRGAY